MTEQTEHNGKLSIEHTENVQKSLKNKNGGYFLTPVVWQNVALYIFLHLCFTYSIWLILTSAKIYTTIWALSLYVASGLSITGGVHRLFSHRAYKAKWPLRLMWVLLYAAAGQNSTYVWVRDHRVHHKYSDTDSDPHNAARGFFFSHMGWLMLKKLPEVKEKTKQVDMSDIEADPIVMFEYKYYYLIFFITGITIPVAVPYLLWGETFWNSLFVGFFFRYVYQLHATWFVNSAAHYWGFRPYESNMMPRENKTVSYITFGEGWHNFHHTFPWDYRAAEYGLRNSLTTILIDLFADIGWAYDVKTVSQELIKDRAKRAGDGSHPLWGWGDKDIPQEEWDKLK